MQILYVYLCSNSEAHRRPSRGGLARSFDDRDRACLLPAAALREAHMALMERPLCSQEFLVEKLICSPEESLIPQFLVAWRGNGG